MFFRLSHQLFSRRGAARSTFFFDRNEEKGIERLALGGGSNCGLYTIYREEVEGREIYGEGQWVLLKKLIEERKPSTIAIDISHTRAFWDGLSAGEREKLETTLGPVITAPGGVRLELVDICTTEDDDSAP